MSLAALLWMNESQRKNLIPFTKETAKENGSKGGKASVKARRRKKKMKQAMEYLLSMPADERYQEQMEILGIDDEYMDNQMLMLISAFQQATKGNVKAMQFIKDITGSQAVSDLEKQRIKLEKERLQLEKEKLEFAKAKSAEYVEDIKVEDDGFLDALNGTAKDDWADGDDAIFNEEDIEENGKKD